MDTSVIQAPEIFEDHTQVPSTGIEQYNLLFNTFFGFRELPFSNTPDTDFLFTSKQHQDVLANMLFGVEQRRGFIVITGEIGAGKSTVCREFLNKLSPEIKTAVILNPNLPGTHLLASIVKDFGIQCPGKTKKDYFEALNQFLLQGLMNQQNACLIIDEAQCLNIKVLEEIRLLSNLETSKQKLLQIVLMGQPELRDLLMRPELTQLRQRIGILCHLEGLGPAETYDYIRHRLGLVCANASEIHFADAVISKIYEISRGIPRLVNSLCDRILMSAYVQQTKDITWEVAQIPFKEMEFVCAA